MESSLQHRVYWDNHQPQNKLIGIEMTSLSAKHQPQSVAGKVAKPILRHGPGAARTRKRPNSFKPDPQVFEYTQAKGGVEAFVRKVRKATPMELVRLERQGVQGTFIKDLSKSMDLASSRVFSILGVPKATAEKKAAAGELVTGRGGQSAIGMIKLLGMAQELVDDSTATEAKGFDAAKWLGLWIETPQSALGGLKPADLIDTPTGVAIVARVLGSIQSGAYQ